MPIHPGYQKLKGNLLLERVGASAPVGEEERETDSLEDTSDGADSNGVKRTLLSDDLGDELIHSLAMSL